jgi:uncharacterized membrane protein
MDKQKVLDEISGKEIDKDVAVHFKTISKDIAELIKKKYPALNENGYIAEKEYNHFLKQYVEELLESDRGALSRIETEVVKSIEEEMILSKNINLTFEKELSIGDKLSDKLSSVAGSWSFIIGFCTFIGVWIFINLYFITKKPFDPYPFILLNLILSTIAALQAPVIMMSQKRLEAKDRARAEHDYQINLKAEIEIRSLHEKMDHLLMKQMQHLSEIQQIQIDLLNKIRESKL